MHAGMPRSTPPWHALYKYAPVEVREEARADHLVGALGLLRALLRASQRRLRLGELVLLSDDALGVWLAKERRYVCGQHVALMGRAIHHTSISAYLQAVLGGRGALHLHQRVVVGPARLSYSSD